MHLLRVQNVQRHGLPACARYLEGVAVAVDIPAGFDGLPEHERVLPRVGLVTDQPRQGMILCFSVALHKPQMHGCNGIAQQRHRAKDGLAALQAVITPGPP